MSVPLWVSEAAEAFWTAVGEPEPFPRTLLRSIAQALPVTVVFLSHLTVMEIEEWIQRKHTIPLTEIPDRPLRACLICRFGQGIIFVDGTDTENEQRFSIAHELAHFLRDYHHPRLRAWQMLGMAVLEVLDGSRSARNDERVASVLSQVEVRPYLHLMDRLDDHARSTINAAESAADRLAFELLAPWELVTGEMEERELARQPQEVMRLLMDRYGLPRDAASKYVLLLTPADPGTSALLRHIHVNSAPVELLLRGPE